MNLPNANGQPTTFTVSEPRYSGTFTVSSSAPSIVAVANVSGNTFQLTSGGQIGSALITISDTAGRNVSFTATSSALSVGIHGSRRQ